MFQITMAHYKCIMINITEIYNLTLPYSCREKIYRCYFYGLSDTKQDIIALVALFVYSVKDQFASMYMTKGVFFVITRNTSVISLLKFSYKFMTKSCQTNHQCTWDHTGELSVLIYVYKKWTVLWWDRTVPSLCWWMHRHHLPWCPLMSGDISLRNTSNGYFTSPDSGDGIRSRLTDARQSIYNRHQCPIVRPITYAHVFVMTVIMTTAMMMEIIFYSDVTHYRWKRTQQNVRKNYRRIPVTNVKKCVHHFYSMSS